MFFDFLPQVDAGVEVVVGVGVDNGMNGTSPSAISLEKSSDFFLRPGHPNLILPPDGWGVAGCCVERTALSAWPMPEEVDDCEGRRGVGNWSTPAAVAEKEVCAGDGRLGLTPDAWPVAGTEGMMKRVGCRQ